jgi:hypothetical protein
MVADVGTCLPITSEKSSENLFGTSFAYYIIDCSNVKAFPTIHYSLGDSGCGGSII